ncbi:MAG: T9SS type A sorting domain-containing protein [Chlorobi bacterium]|nr:T9SS type A sorting domain-containing protein [Chlorobiota bacterium]MCI0716149.1 T9SS type A sorting domain-containing protein [Chlorobiota bacterium]
MKKLLYILTINCTLLTANCFTQSITWQKVLNNDYGWLNKIQQTSDGGYIAVGEDRINNEPKMYLVKLNYLGNTLWTKIIGVGNTAGYWVEETMDRGYIIGGYIDSGLVDDKVYLVKTDSLGKIQWHKTFSNSDLDQCRCVKQTPDGGYILSCITFPFRIGAFYIKTDSLGNEQWRQIYYSNTIHIFMHEIEVLSFGYIASGSKGIDTTADAYIMRLDLSGDTLWTKSYGGNNASTANSIHKIGNNGFIIGGSSFNPNNFRDSYVIRTDTNGNIIWERTYSGYQLDACQSIRYKPGTGFVMAGYSDDINGLRAKIRILDMNGFVLREASFYGEGNEAAFNSLELCSDGGYISAGYSDANTSSMYIVKTDSLLFANPIGIINNNTNEPDKFILHQNFPNPFNPSTVIKIEIKTEAKINLMLYDITGKEIKKLINSNLSSGIYSVNVNAYELNLSSGIYFYTLYVNDSFYPISTRKMVFLK